METQTKSYAELIKLPSYEERFEYLKLSGTIGEETFGQHARYLNQRFYQSKEWRDFRRKILVRDIGDLGIEEHPLGERAIIHHINPITEEQVLAFDPALLDPDNVVAVSYRTHEALHFGNIETAFIRSADRSPNDTCPWKGGR